MNLKEAFRYQNYLEKMFQNAGIFLHSKANITKVQQEHMRSKANPDASDETIDASVERVVDCSPDMVVNYLLAVLREKHDLSIAVNNAKRSIDFDMDAEVTVNKFRQSAKATLDDMCRVKPSERITKGSDFKFNAEGNQVSYYYDVKETTSIDFNRDVVRSLVKELAAESDRVSAEADRCIIETEVDFRPSFDLADSFEDSLAAFAVNHASNMAEAYIRHAV